MAGPVFALKGGEGQVGHLGDGWRAERRVDKHQKGSSWGVWVDATAIGSAAGAIALTWGGDMETGPMGPGPLDPAALRPDGSRSWIVR